MACLLQKYTKNQKIDANRPSGKEIQDAVKQVAFMNLNKRGGSQKVNEKVLNDYVEEYKNEIKEEILFLLLNFSTLDLKTLIYFSTPLDTFKYSAPF